MKKLFGILFLLAISLPALAQWRLSPRDQQRFDSYFSRWQEYKRVNDSGQIISMEKRMLDVYAHYGIPAGTPFWRIATNARPERVVWRERLSREERARFDDLYARWISARDQRDHFEMERLEHHMREIMAHNGIPVEVRFEELAGR
ncbi:MAG TPA: hypothetical protein VJO35_12665 [Terriglobales bacterium]|nr:hypothetical protein [Terriglobales bacterium]